MSPRYRKLIRDVWLARTRMAMMVAAITVSLTAVGAILTGLGVLQKEMKRNYLGTHPAAATLELPTALTPQQLSLVGQVPGVSGATLRHSVQARFQTPQRWQQLLLFVIAPDDPLRISGFDVLTGSWPPQPGTLLLERSSVSYFGLKEGEPITVRGPGGKAFPMRVSGTVHDAGVAPSQQETLGYGYVTPQTLALLGEQSALDDLKLAVDDPQAAEAVAQSVSRMLAGQGVLVERIQVPPPLRHPHQTQMDTVSLLLLIFCGAGLLLSAILVATMLGGMLAQQVRQIAVMKVSGARVSQIFAMYLLLTAVIAVAATVLSLPPAQWLGSWLARAIAGLLNLDLAGTRAPGWATTVQIGAGLLIPVIIAMVPLWRGSRVTVREAIDDHGVTPGRRLRARTLIRDRALAMAWRNMFRRRVRLALTVTMLAAAGAIFLTGLNTASGWTALTAEGVSSRHYDLEFRLDKPAPAAEVTRLVGAVTGVGRAESWLTLPAQVANSEGATVARVYPDGGHGSLSITGIPAGSDLITPKLTAGRWLSASDTDAIVVNQLVPFYQGRQAEVGETITLTVGGRSTAWHVVGAVADFGSQGTAYVTDSGLRHATGTSGVNLIRVVAASGGQETETLNRVELALVDAGYGVRSAFPVSQLAVALDGHVSVLIVDLIAVAIILAIVGFLGLASAMGTNVTERTREFAVMHAVGATPSNVRWIVTAEGLLTATVSLVIAIAAAVPLTVMLGRFAGNQAFHLPLPFGFSLPGLLLWSIAALAGAALASAAAAGRTSRLTVRQALTIQ